MSIEIIKFKNRAIKLDLRDESDISIMREIFKIKEYKIADQVIISGKQPILDVGAHAGFFSIYTRILNNDVRILTLEPARENIKALKNNLEINNISNIDILESALYIETGTVKLNIAEDNIFHSISDSGEDVPSITLRDLATKNNIQKFSLIKMDIEGAEFDIINNLSNEDFNLFDSIIFEYHDDNGKNHKELENILRINKFGVQVFKSKYESHLGFIFANKKA